MKRDKGRGRRRLILQIAFESELDVRTIERWISGDRVNPATDRVLRSTIEKIGITEEDLRPTTGRKKDR